MQKFTPLQCQLVKVCICAEFVDAKLWEKSNYEIPEGVPTKVPSIRYVIMVIMVYIPRFNSVYKVQCFQGRVFEAKPKNIQIVFVLNLVEISKHFLIFISILLKITETRFDSGPFCYFWSNILFAAYVPHVYVNTLNYALILYPVMNIAISRKPVDISRCTSCMPALNKYITRSPMCPPRP